MAFAEPSPARSPALPPPEFGYLQGLLQRRTGVVLEAGKEYLVEMRLTALAEREGFASLRDLLESLHTEEPWGFLHGRVVEALLIGETSFFRDVLPFEAIRSHLLPEILGARSEPRSLHVWSAGCASGQEAYSIAMMVREHFSQLLDWNLRIIGSDVSEAALERAREGRYTQIEVNRGLPAPLLVRHFEKTGSHWRLRDPIRRMVEFREINLAAALPTLPPMDLVLLRNVLIYFDPATRRAALERIRAVVRPGGFLLLGGGETLASLEGFEPVIHGRAASYRRRPSVPPRGKR